jgi:hypothetical protein
MGDERISSTATVKDAVLAGWVVVPPGMMRRIVESLVLFEVAAGDTVDANEYTDFVDPGEIDDRVETLRRRAHGTIEWNGTAL